MNKFIINIILVFAIQPLFCQISYTAVEPVIKEHCVSCHHPNGPGPFSLCTYEDVARHASTVAKVIASGFMPPWKADPSYSHYKNEKLLTEKEKKMVLDWVSTGAYKTEKSRNFEGKCPLNSYSREGKPDIRLKMPQPVIIDKDGGDKFYIVKIPFEFSQDTFVSCIEFCPGNKKIVHHLNYQIMSVDSGADIFSPPYIIESKDIEHTGQDDMYSYFKMRPTKGNTPVSVFYGGWAPGYSGLRAPEGFGIRLPKRGVILLNVIHYSSPPGGQVDSSWFNLFLASTKTKPLDFDMLTVGSSRKMNSITPHLNIPPEHEGWYTTSYTLIHDYLAAHVEAHMHTLGKKFIAYAVNGGDTIPLIRINDWDFDWQETCEFQKPLLLKKGTELIVKGYYDNTSANARNPFHPPVFISETDGMKTTGEMLSLILFGKDYK